MPATISTSERLDGLEERVEEVLQLVERIIDHILPQSYSLAYRTENAEALHAWPKEARNDG
jgi:hypothetical protein